MVQRYSFFKDDFVNFVTRNENGEVTVTRLAPEDVAKSVGQNFTWGDDILVEEDTKLSCYLLKTMLTKKDQLEYLNKLMKPETCKVLILSDNNYYFMKKDGVSRSIVCVTVPEKNLAALQLKFKELKSNNPTLVNDKETLKLLTSILGDYLDINLLNNTCSIESLQERFRDIAVNHNKLAITKINDVVGYGVITLGDIEAGSTVSVYSGIFRPGHQNAKDDIYLSGIKAWGVSQKNYRNYAGFVTHAFGYRYSANELSITDFAPRNQDISAWQTNVLAANLNTTSVVYDHIPYAFFESKRFIPKGSILAFDYGLSYWQTLKVVPALLTLEGDIIDPRIYKCSFTSYNLFVAKLAAEEQQERSVKVSDQSVFKPVVPVNAQVVAPKKSYGCLLL